MAKYTRTRVAEDWEVARTLRNTVTRLLKSENCRFAREIVRNCEEQQDSRKLWQNIRSYICTGGAPSMLTDTAGQLTTSPAIFSNMDSS